MGRFSYSKQARLDVEDRALAHLQVVIGNKLRRHEAFYFTWREDPSTGNGRKSVWMHPGVDLEFTYFGSRQPSLNPDWLEALSMVANSSRGLYLVHEPATRPPHEATKTVDEFTDAVG